MWERAWERGGGSARDETTSSMVWSEMDDLMKNVTPAVDQVHFTLPIHISLTWMHYIMDLTSNLKRKLLSEVYSRDFSAITYFFPTPF